MLYREKVWLWKHRKVNKGLLNMVVGLNYIFVRIPQNF